MSPPAAWSPSKLPDVSDTSVVAAAVSAATPISILGSLSFWFTGANGTLADAGSGVCSQWSDSGGGGFNCTFAGAARPGIQLTGLNGKPTLRFGTSHWGGNASFSSPAPGTTPGYFFAIAKFITIIDGGVLLGRGATGATYTTTSGGGVITDANPTGAPFSSVITANTWYRIEWQESNQATDYIKVNGLSGFAANAGNGATTGVYMNGVSSGPSGNCEIAELFRFPGIPTTPQRTQLASYSQSIWGV